MNSTPRSMWAGSRAKGTERSPLNSASSPRKRGPYRRMITGHSGRRPSQRHWPVSARSGACHRARIRATRWLARDDEVRLQLRLVARDDFGLRFRLAEAGLVVDDLADRRKRPRGRPGCLSTTASSASRPCRNGNRLRRRRCAARRAAACRIPSIAESSAGSLVTVPLPPTRSVSSMPGTKKIICNRPEPSTMFLKLSIRLLPGRSGISSSMRAFDMDEARMAAARRGIDAAVGAGRREHAERRHLDEFSGVNVDLRPRLGDHARGRGRVDRLEVVGVKLAHHRSPKNRQARPKLSP